MIRNSFDKGPESWCSYDYHACILSGGQNIFILTTWLSQGGVNNSGYIWTDHTRWSTDVPERPVSILAMLLYRNWINADPIDLRGAEVSVYLRGDNLRLHGGQCYFWVHGSKGGGRWHYTSQPLTISDGRWADEPLRFRLRNETALWHNSWSGLPPNPRPLETVLANVGSYGFSFVGFALEPDGKFSMDEFEIKPATSA
ncbi:MAG: hypothetical protein HY326_10820 [Chloroflexi bacterium]|nr:hypothetical protein [Chloroflexota bacterium]